MTRNAPGDYARLLAPLPANVVFGYSVAVTTDLVHCFCDRKADLKRNLGVLRKTIKADGMVWISWPKKASKVPTDITEDTIRELARPLGYVDVRVCAVSEVWSGLKLVIRKSLR